MENNEITIWPRWRIWLDSAWTHLTWWPWRTRKLKRAGMTRIGWMTYAELGPPPWMDDNWAGSGFTVRNDESADG